MHKMPTSLRLEVEKELSRIFRYFLDGGIQIVGKRQETSNHNTIRSS